MQTKKVVEIFGKMSIQLVVALSMHTENMQRQNLGQSIAYGEEQFGMVINMVEKLLEEIK